MRIVIADDHPMMRRALAEAVAGALPAPVEIGEAGSFVEANAELSQRPAQLLLLDLHMPGMSGFAGLVALRAAFPSLPIVVVSASQDAPLIRRAIEFGAAGYIPKSVPIAQIGQALRAVLAGDIWVPDMAAAEMPAKEETSRFATRVAELTPQQLRVLILLAEGKHNKQIAYEMEISEATVKFHLSQIFRKLGVQSRTQAVIAAQQMRITAGADALLPDAGDSSARV